MRILKQTDVEALIDTKLKALADQLEALLDTKHPLRRNTLRSTNKGKILAQMDALRAVRRHLAFVQEPGHNEVATEWLGL